MSHFSLRPLSDCPLREKCPQSEQYNAPLYQAALCDLCSLCLPHHIGPRLGGIIHGLSCWGFPYIFGPGQTPSENMRLEAVDSQNYPYLWHSSILPLLDTSCFSILALACLCLMPGIFTDSSLRCSLSFGCLPFLGSINISWTILS